MAVRAHAVMHSRVHYGVSFLVGLFMLGDWYYFQDDSRVLCLSLLAGLLLVGLWYLCPILQTNRFGSFAPVREAEETRAKWYVDGEDYMSAVADAILAAEHEILITDWQMNPYIFMKRPENGVTSLEWRLDKLLLKKAEESDFRIVILLYKEPLAKKFIDLGNKLVTDILNWHPNIEILYHPPLSTFFKYFTKLPFRWSHHEKIVVIDRSVAFVGGIDLAYGRWDTHSHSLFDNYSHHPCVLEQPAEYARKEDSSKRYCRWTGKDYGNTFLGGDRSKFDKPFEDYVDRRTTPRMPWHDVSCSFDGPAALDIAKHFIQRYRAVKQKWWWKVWKLFQKSGIYGDIDDPVGWAGSSTRIAAVHGTTSNPQVKIQVLRSVDKWSANLPHEDSIHKAYIHAIKNAEHSIYIENQFFISSQPKVKNKIQHALAERIIRAYKKSEDFHVMIVLPLQPEFPGEWGTYNDGELAIVSYYNNATLRIGKNSLFHRLKIKIPEKFIPRYFSVYSLRTHEVWPSDTRTGFKSEIIYVHSKLMIVDDRISIIGSANINDRSMLGSRDSEVNVIIEDKEMIDGTMNGLPYRVGKFSHNLRCHLVKEHLGLLERETLHSDVRINVKDPVAKEFYMQLSEIAASNTEIYESVFPRRPAKLIRPTNAVRSRNDLKNWTAFDGLSIEEAREKLKKVRGRLIIYSAFFLEKNLITLSSLYPAFILKQLRILLLSLLGVCMITPQTVEDDPDLLRFV